MRNIENIEKKKGTKWNRIFSTCNGFFFSLQVFAKSEQNAFLTSSRQTILEGFIGFMLITLVQQQQNAHKNHH